MIKYRNNSVSLTSLNKGFYTNNKIEKSWVRLENSANSLDSSKEKITERSNQRRFIKSMESNDESSSSTVRREIKSVNMPNSQVVLTRPSIMKHIKRLKKKNSPDTQSDVADIIDKCETFNSIFLILESAFNDIIKREHEQIFEDTFYLELEAFLYFYNDQINRRTLENIQSNKSFSEDTKLALNCWNVSINIIGLCCNVGVRREKCENNINVLQLVFKYVNEYWRFVCQDIVARRTVEVALYCLCNYYYGQIGLNKENRNKIDLDVLKKCFGLENNFKEIKLSSGIILSYIIPSSDPLSKEILSHLTNVPISNDGEYLGISGDIVNCAIKNLERIILS